MRLHALSRRKRVEDRRAIATGMMMNEQVPTTEPATDETAADIAKLKAQLADHRSPLSKHLQQLRAGKVAGADRQGPLKS